MGLKSAFRYQHFLITSSERSFGGTGVRAQFARVGVELDVRLSGSAQMVWGRGVVITTLMPFSIEGPDRQRLAKLSIFEYFDPREAQTRSLSVIEDKRLRARVEEGDAILFTQFLRKALYELEETRALPRDVTPMICI